MKSAFTPNFKYLLSSAFVLSSLGFVGTEAAAAPLADRDLISILQFDGSSITGTTSTAAIYSQNLPSPNGNVIKGYGDLTTGKVGTSVDSTSGNSGQIVVQIFDTLKFNTIGATPTQVSFDYTYDGSLYEPIGFTDSYAQSRVWIYDITGIASWLESSSFGTAVEVNVVNRKISS